MESPSSSSPSSVLLEMSQVLSRKAEEINSRKRVEYDTPSSTDPEGSYFKQLCSVLM